jgi:Tol biopolymer transport system component
MKKQVGLMAVFLFLTFSCGLFSSCVLNTGNRRINRQNKHIKFAIKTVYQNSKFQSIAPVAFSPNGKRILLIVTDSSGATFPAIINRDGTDFRTLIYKPEIIYKVYGFSPDGSKILYTTADENIYAIGTVAGSKPVQLINASDSIGIVSPVSFSPNGRFLLYNSDDKNGSRVNIANADGSNSRQLTDFDSFAVGFSPDGSKILFCSRKKGKVDVMTMDKNGQNKVVLGEGTPISFTAHGHRILYKSHDEIKLMSQNGSNKTTVLNGFLYVATTASPNGNIIAFYKATGKGFCATCSVARIGLIRNDGTDRTILNNRHGGNFRFVDFSPNGQDVLFASYDGNGKNWKIKVVHLKK